MKLKNVSVITLGVAMTLGMASCKKEAIKKNVSGTNPEAASTEKTYTYESGIRSNEGYQTYGETDRHYYKMYGNSGLGQQTLYTYDYFGGAVGSTVKGYGSNGSTEVFVYQRDGATLLRSLPGGEYVINHTNGTFFNETIEEIELHPVTNEIYALVKTSTAIQIYRINIVVDEAIATPLTLNGSTTIFNDPVGNGYKSGSICFIPDPIKSGMKNLVFTHESTASGITSWYYFPVTNNALSFKSGYTRNYTGLPENQVGKINTVYGEGKFYFAKDGTVSSDGKLYELSTTSGTWTYTSKILANKNDFGWWSN